MKVCLGVMEVLSLGENSGMPSQMWSVWLCGCSSSSSAISVVAILRNKDPTTRLYIGTLHDFHKNHFKFFP